MKNKENSNLNVFYSAAILFQTFQNKVAVCRRNVFAVTADVLLEHDQEFSFRQNVSENFSLPSLKVESFCFQLFSVVYRYGFAYCASHKLTSLQPCVRIATSGMSSSNRCLFGGEQFYLDFPFYRFSGPLKKDS